MWLVQSEGANIEFLVNSGDFVFKVENSFVEGLGNKFYMDYFERVRAISIFESGFLFNEQISSR
jgi:hypothetical protein